LSTFSDLLAAALLTLVTAPFVFVSPLNATPLRPVLALGFVLLVPGHAAVSAILPRSEQHRVAAWRPTGRERGTDPADEADRGVSHLGSLVLAFGVSVALVILVGFVLGITRVGITRASLFGSLASLTGVYLLVAAVRRSRVPPAERYYLPVGTMLGEARGWVAGDGTRSQWVVNLALAVAVVVAATAVGVSVGGQQTADVTEFALLTQNEDGEFVGSNYPSSISGAGEPFVVEVGNHEGESVEYSIVVLMQQFEGGGVGDEAPGELTSERELRRFEATVEDGETWRVEHRIAPDEGGEDLRLTYLLYVGQPPTDPTTDNAYRELHLWVDVETGSVGS
jgi:uncharacterized membrane protein